MQSRNGDGLSLDSQELELQADVGCCAREPGIQWEQQVSSPTEPSLHLLYVDSKTWTQAAKLVQQALPTESVHHMVLT